MCKKYRSYIRLRSSVRAIFFPYLINLLIFLGLLITIGLAGSESYASPLVTLNFKDSVLINDTVIYLGDVADVGTTNTELALKLRSVVAGNAAPAGYSRFLNADDFILYRLRSQFDKVQFKISGCHRVFIKTDFFEKRISDYLPIIEDYFEKKVLWPRGNWEVKVLEPQRSWRCLADSFNAEVKGLETGYPKGHVQVWLNMNQGNRQIRIPVSCNIKVVVPVLVAKTSIVRGQVITSQDCELKEMDITRFGPEPLFKISVLNGVRAIRTFAAGTIIHTRLIQTMPVVEKGDFVDILVSKGRVKVAVQGIAREAGKVGERIWVENSMSRKLIQAIIKSKGTVTIAQGGLPI